MPRSLRLWWNSDHSQDAVTASIRLSTTKSYIAGPLGGIQRSSQDLNSTILMKPYFKLTTFLLFAACNSYKETIHFDTIDYSSFWGYYQSIKIHNTGKTYIYYKDFTENTCYYSFDIDKSQIDSLSQMIKALYTIKLDSVYILERDSGRDFSLIINSDQGRLATTYSGPYGGVEGLDKLYQFIDHLILLSHNLRKSVDSDFDFESKTKLKMILPAPPLIE